MGLLILLVCVLCLLASSSATFNELFALDDVPGSPGSFRLVTIDLEDGTRVPVSQTGAEKIKYTPGMSTIDHDHSILYFLGQLKLEGQGLCNMTLVGVSLETGAVVSTTNIPGADPVMKDGEIWTAGVAYASDLAAVVLSVSTAANRHLVGIVPTGAPGGEWTVVATVDQPQSIVNVQPVSATYVPKQQLYIFQLGVNHVITQFAYNFKTGIMRNASSPQFTDFVYNPTDGMIWGHGVAEGPKKTYFVRTLRKMDPSTLKVELVDSGLEVLTCDDGPHLTLDVDRQIMIWATDLYKDVVAKPTGPFPVHLAQVSLANPSVVNISVLLCPVWECPECSYNTSCPATLNYA